MLQLIIKLITIAFSPETTDLSGALYKYAQREINSETALEHTIAARLAETSDVPASLLLSMAYSESRYNPYAVSHVRDGKRQGGIFKGDKPPAGVSGPYFCGVTQVMARHSWKKCVEFRDIHLAYQTAAHELTKWISMCRGKNDQLRCALFGYGGGFPAIKAGTSTYPNRVINRSKILEKRSTGNT